MLESLHRLTLSKRLADKLVLFIGIIYQKRSFDVLSYWKLSE